MPSLSIKRIWCDIDVVEIECVVESAEFRGKATAYAAPNEVAKFADRLDGFLRNPVGRVALTTGLQDGSKSIKIEVYSIDMAGHLAVRVSLATEGSRPENISRLETEIAAETWSLMQFASALRQLNATGDEAVMNCNI
jgi:hypothetical protein